MSFPTTYVKGEHSQLAYSESDVVNLRFKGFVPAEDVPATEISYEDLRTQAKELGIPASGKKLDLFKAVADGRAAAERAAAEAIAAADQAGADAAAGESAGDAS